MHNRNNKEASPSITPRDASEEFFHAYQHENKVDYELEGNREFEAKFFSIATTQSGGEVDSLGSLATSFRIELRSLSSLCDPHSSTVREFLKEYYAQQDIFVNSSYKDFKTNEFYKQKSHNPPAALFKIIRNTCKP